MAFGMNFLFRVLRTLWANNLFDNFVFYAHFEDDIVHAL